MKILSASELKHIDQETVHRQGITSDQLMERAAKAVYDRITADLLPYQGTFAVVCGAGNNGGDGLALARLLFQSGHRVDVFLEDSQKYSADNIKNQDRLRSLAVHVNKFKLGETIAIPKENTVVIDALFGYGLSRPLDAEWHALIDQMNHSSHRIFSIDLPSGLISDRYTDKNSPIVKADDTYTFQCPKLALLLPENAAYTGNVHILDIQLDPESIALSSTKYFYTIIQMVREFTPKHDRFAHKGTFGHVLIAGGSYGKIGSTVLSSQAALKTGCGLVTTYVPQCGYGILQSSFSEAMVLTDDNDKIIANFPEDLKSYAAIGLGIGMGTDEITKQALYIFLKNVSSQPHQPAVVLDADALNILANQQEWLSLLPPNSILTPHPKELQRLIGTWGDDTEKLEKTKAFSNKYQVIVLIKGANTNIVQPDGNVYFNSTGNWGMATGGSGDVLTGVITSLLAQGYVPEHAAIAGVFLHGLAGDLGIKEIHPKSLIASDIVRHIPNAWNEILP